MKIFCLDSSTSSASVAILDGEKVLFSHTEDFGVTHSEMLMPLCDRAFVAAGLTPCDIDVYAVCNGPGSYTGLRIGLAVIKGLALACDRPCVPINTLKTLAAAHRGRVLALINARRGNYFCACYDVGEANIKEVLEPSALHGEEIAKQFAGQNILLTGDGAQMFYDGAAQQNFTVAKCHMPSAEVAARLAALHYKEHGGCDSVSLAADYVKDVHIG